jgi:hypothetical protein
LISRLLRRNLKLKCFLCPESYSRWFEETKKIFVFPLKAVSYALKKQKIDTFLCLRKAIFVRLRDLWTNPHESNLYGFLFLQIKSMTQICKDRTCKSRFVSPQIRIHKDLLRAIREDLWKQVESFENWLDSWSRIKSMNRVF